MAGLMDDDALMFFAGEHVMSNWLRDEPQSRTVVSALMTATSLATQTINIEYVWEHSSTVPHRRFLFPVELGLQLIELSLPGHRVCCYGEKLWQL